MTRCAGLVARSRAGEELSVASRAVILATGGMAALWARTTNPRGAVGAGLTLADGAGARLADLEFMQFHPTALRRDGPRDGFLITEAVRGEGARLVDAAVTLGELELVGGAVDAAATLADRVLGADPYAERAHRLAVAAYMQGRDRAATTAAVDRLARMLAELGARPESTTQILLRNAAQWLGPLTTATAPG